MKNQGKRKSETECHFKRRKINYLLYSQCFPSNFYISVFRSKKPLHSSQCWLKQYTAKREMTPENIVKRTCRNFNIF